MNKRYQVFVSSTYTDLAKQREKVIHELTRVGFIAVGMEQFPATDESQIEYINKIIDESDYYVVIIKGKYGSVANDGISYTEKEYIYAASKPIPCVAFLFEDIGKLTLDDTDNDPEKMKRLQLFREELKRNKVVKFWGDDAELAGSVKDTLYDLVRRKPGIGYVRGDQVLDISIANEKIRLEEENARLKLEIESINSATLPKIEGIDEIVNFEFIVTKDDGFSGRVIKSNKHEINISWRDLFMLVYEAMETNATERDIIGSLLRDFVRISGLDTGYDHVNFAADDPSEIKRKIRLTLERMGLISAEFGVILDNSRSIPGNAFHQNRSIEWQLTALGKRFVIHNIGIV